jgi:hypothetical protein
MRANKNRVFIRRIAAVTLALWFVAQFVCFQHCTTAAQSSSKAILAKTCCHAQNHGDSKSSHTTPSIGCLSLKMMLPGADAAISIPFDQFQSLAVVLFMRPAAPALKISANDRQARQPDCVIAHEVSLGSAAHTHAPPFLS